MSDWSPTAPLFSERLRRILRGTPFGAVFPPHQPPPTPDVDGRTHALRALRAYVLEIIFRIPNPPNPPKSYRLEHTAAQPRFHFEREDWAQNELFPSMVVVPGEHEYLPIGLTPQTIEESRDVHGPGTVLVVSYEYQERITLEVWASTKQMRRSLAAGVEAMLEPVEEFAGIRLVMPGFYGETVRFTPLSRSTVDDDDSSRRRRKVNLVIEMNFNLVRLVRYAPIRPVVTATVTDPTG